MEIKQIVPTHPMCSSLDRANDTTKIEISGGVSRQDKQRTFDLASAGVASRSTLVPHPLLSSLSRQICLGLKAST
jgi:hypothetical protein